MLAPWRMMKVHKLIAEQTVANQILATGLLAPTVQAAMNMLGRGASKLSPSHH